jgi:hypothetical protein
MAGIEDAIREDAIIKDAIRNYQKRGAGLPSLQLSPELLKALQVPENKGLGSVFPEETGYYDSFIKSIGGDPENPATELGKYASYPGKAIAYGAEGIISTLKGLGLSGDRISGSPLTDNLVNHLTSTPESTRQNLGQDILRQLSGEDRRQQGQLANKTSSTMGQGSGEYLDTRGQIGDTGIEAAIGDGNIDEDALIATQKLNEAADEKARDAVLAAEDDAEANAGQDLPVNAEEKKKNAQQSLFASAMKDFNETYSGGTTKDSSRKSIDDYKKDFAEATGIDISGEPDNKLALMSLGLSLMQNRAGKGFNFSNILTSVGQAGQDALPLFEKAKADARAGQVASGKYALQETKADTIAQAALLQEKRTALNNISKEMRSYQNQYLIQAMKDQNSTKTALIQAKSDAIKNNKLDLTKTIDQEVQGLTGVKISFGFDQNGSEKILNGVSAARGLADGYGNLLQANDSINYLIQINSEIANATSPATYILGQRGAGILASLGIKGEDLFKDQTFINSDGKQEVIKGISKEAGVQAVQDRLLAQFKRFLSQETGNGISNVDFKNLEKQVGLITTFGNPADRVVRLKELKKMFAVPMNRVKSLFDQLNDRRFHANEDNYIRTQEVLFDVLRKTTPKQYQNRIKVGKGGIQIIDVTG